MIRQRAKSIAIILTLVGVVLASSEDNRQAAAALPAMNGKIVFEAIGGIATVNPDGSAFQLLSGEPDSADTAPAFSPDGTQIAFTRVVNKNFDIYVMMADGSDVRRLTDNPGLDLKPSWSPDGTQIAFYRYSSFVAADIFTMNADGTNETNLTNSAGSELFPDWSSDGEKIAYYYYAPEDGFNSEIYVMNADGTGAVNITNLPQVHDMYPSWSPDGSKIAFSSARGQGQATVAIFVMNADGTDVIELTHKKTLYEQDYSPTWSPDGSKIAFVRSHSPTYQSNIFIMNPDGSSETQVTSSSSQSPDWQLLVDTDADGCTNDRELGAEPGAGGQRNVNDFWDFFDTPNSSNARDQEISALDLFRVLSRFGASGENGIDPLSPPSAAPAYHTAFDRSSMPDSFSGEADGSITAKDVFLLMNQFGHSCA